MPTYNNINNEYLPSSKEEEARGGIFRKLQTWINQKGFFGKDVNTNADERVLTGYEHLKTQELVTSQQSVEDRINKNYEVNQIERYREFENMERVAEVASALDLIADECIQIGDNGHVVKIKTKNERIKEELGKLFFEILKIDQDAWDKVRTMILYGNRYEEIVINKKDPGVLYLNFIDPASIERVEIKGRLSHFQKVKYQDKDLRVTVYPNKGTQNEYVLQPFRIVHYRIEDSRFRPYGKSVLEPARRTIRQLNMMEDAMTTYRYSRASEKRVWSIDCGDLGPDDAMKYTTQVRDTLRKKPKFNPTTGELDYEMNPLCISLATKIKLLDGRDLELKNIIKEYEEGKELWTMSADSDGEYHIGKIKWAGITKRNTEVVKVTLDDGSEHITTPDHKFIMRDGSKKRADSLIKDDSLMPLYTKDFKYNKNSDYYEHYYQLNKREYKNRTDRGLHKLVAEQYYNENIVGNKLVHHKNYKEKKNNNPTNLKVMSKKEHSNLHLKISRLVWDTPEIKDRLMEGKHKFWNSDKGKERKEKLSEWRVNQNIKNNTVENMKWYNNSELHKEHNEIRSKNMKERFSDENYVEQFSELKTMIFDDFIYDKVREAFINNSINSDVVCDYLNDCPEFFEHLQAINKNKVICSEFNNMNRHFLLRILREQGYSDFEDYKQSLLIDNFEPTEYQDGIEYNLINYKEDRQKSNRMLFDEYLSYKVKEATIYEGKTINNVAKYLNEDEISISHLKKINKNQNVPSNLENFNKQIILKLLKSMGHNSFKEFKETLKPNHRVLKVEHLEHKIDTGCIEVDNELHNFPILCNNFKKRKSYTFVSNSITEDFFIPIRSGFTNNSVTPLPGAQNLGEIDDVLYFKKKLMFALKIPLAFIGEEGLSYSKSNLALIDIRFARMIERLQRFFVKGLEKVAVVHLLLKKFSLEDIKNFEIEITPASNIKKLSDLEFMNNKFGAIQQARGTELFPDLWLLTNIWGSSEEEAENLLKMMKIQKAGGDMEAGAEGGAGMAGGLGGGMEELGIGPEVTPAEEGGGGEEVPAPGVEVAGGEAGEVGVPEATVGGAEALSAGFNPNKNPYAYILTEELRKNPEKRKTLFKEFQTCVKYFKDKKIAKKNEDNKDNILNNSLREFTVFGEINGLSEYKDELDKNLFEEKKSRRKK